MSESSRRLDLTLPANHPIFQYPVRVRAKVAREWLDIGARLAAIEMDVDTRLKTIEHKIDHLLSNQEVKTPGSITKQDNQSENRVNVIKYREALFDAFNIDG